MRAAGAGAFEEIVVTARKREESLEDIPRCLDRVYRRDFANLNMSDLYDVGKNVPNLFIGNFGNGNQNHTSVFLRGVGTQDHIITVDSAVGLYLERCLPGPAGGFEPEPVRYRAGGGGARPAGHPVRAQLNRRRNQRHNQETRGSGRTDADRAGGDPRPAANSMFTALPRYPTTCPPRLPGYINRRNGVGEFINQPDTEVEVGQVREASVRAMFNFTPSDDFFPVAERGFLGRRPRPVPDLVQRAPGAVPQRFARQPVRPRPG